MYLICILIYENKSQTKILTYFRINSWRNSSLQNSTSTQHKSTTKIVFKIGTNRSDAHRLVLEVLV